MSEKDSATNRTGTVDSPYKPSVKFTALEEPIITKMANLKVFKKNGIILVFLKESGITVMINYMVL